jgi:hypothetical protein
MTFFLNNKKKMDHLLDLAEEVTAENVGHLIDFLSENIDEIIQECKDSIDNEIDLWFIIDQLLDLVEFKPKEKELIEKIDNKILDNLKLKKRKRTLR